jgi:hypothetical protein
LHFMLESVEGARACFDVHAFHLRCLSLVVASPLSTFSHTSMCVISLRRLALLRWSLPSSIPRSSGPWRSLWSGRKVRNHLPRCRSVTPVPRTGNGFSRTVPSCHKSLLSSRQGPDMASTRTHVCPSPGPGLKSSSATWHTMSRRLGLAASCQMGRAGCAGTCMAMPMPRGPSSVRVWPGSTWTQCTAPWGWVVAQKGVMLRLAWFALLGKGHWGTLDAWQSPPSLHLQHWGGGTPSLLLSVHLSKMSRSSQTRAVKLWRPLNGVHSCWWRLPAWVG